MACGGISAVTDAGSFLQRIVIMFVYEKMKCLLLYKNHGQSFYRILQKIFAW